jgi:hypothetical protein
VQPSCRVDAQASCSVSAGCRLEKTSCVEDLDRHEYRVIAVLPVRRGLAHSSDDLVKPVHRNRASTDALLARPLSDLRFMGALGRSGESVDVEPQLNLRCRVEAAARHPPTGDALDYACAMLDEPSHATYDA